MEIKTLGSKMIDYLEALKNDEKVRISDETPEQFRNRTGEKFRCIALAQTEIETACMYAVKAVFTD